MVIHLNKIKKDTAFIARKIIDYLLKTRNQLKNMKKIIFFIAVALLATYANAQDSQEYKEYYENLFKHT